MKKLLIVSSSSRILKEPKEPVQAVKRFDGIMIRSIRNYVNRLKSVDVLILSPVYGLIPPEKKIPYHEPIGGSWPKIEFSKTQIRIAQKVNLPTIRNILSQQKYNEIYVNVGKTMLRLIEGFDQFVPKTTKIIYAKGKGIGPKMAHMKKWMEQQTR